MSHTTRDALAAAATWGDALHQATAWLRDTAASDSPSLDAQVLLAHVTSASRPALLAYPERPLTREQAALYADLVARRANREPVAYLTGHREFLGLDFLTDPRALIPRPETELLVEAALTELRVRFERTPDAALIAADIGTGSGAIAVSLAAHEPRLTRVYATDISPDALALAAENAQWLGVSDRITFLQGDLLSPLPEPVDLLLANLPYVAERDATTLPPDVARFEPQLALYSADDGLAHLRRFFADAPAHLRHGAALVLEFGYDQRDAVTALARQSFPTGVVRIGTDYAGWDRYAIVHTSSAHS